MLKTNENDFFESVIFHAIGEPPTIKRIQFLSGGYGNNVVKLETSVGNFCVKWHETLPEKAFIAQKADLSYLNRLGVIQVPEPISAGKINQKSFLLMEDIGLHLPKNNFWELLGEQLALLHANNQKTFGWQQTNWLHGFALKNSSETDWATFYFENRLKPLFGKAFFEGKIEEAMLRKIDMLQEKTKQLFPKEPPSLVHGNLYRDNIIAGEGGLPFLQSPVPYFGNRELELVRVLFLNDIPEVFFDAYQTTFPLSENFEDRKPLYQLYILGQYLNQFGASYLGGVEKIFNKFL